LMPVEEWEDFADLSEEPDDPDNWEDEAEE
jgi:hypothetical protein